MLKPTKKPSVQPDPVAPPPRYKVLISAYACEPHKSSEPGVGWETALHMSQAHDVWLMTSDEHRIPIEEEIARCPQPHIHWVFVKVPRWLTFWKKGERGRRIHYMLWQLMSYFAGRRLHKEVGFDVTHHVTYVSYWTPNYLALLPVPFVWGPIGGGETTPEAFLPTLTPRGRRYDAIRSAVRGAATRLDPFVRITARRAKISLVTTQETAAILSGLGAKRIRVMTEVLFASETIAQMAAKPLAPASHRFTVISIGRLLDWKGFHLGIAAFARFLEEYPDAEYRIIGDGPQREDLKAQAQALGIASKVKFTGLIPRSEVLQNLAHAHVLVHPSLHETGGWVCVEAMAIGRPVICLNLGGPGQQVTPDTGFAVPADSPEQAIEDMAQALLKLARDPELLHTMGRAGRLRVFHRHNWDHRIAEMTNIYQEVVGA